jgi:hypothetical protein
LPLIAASLSRRVPDPENSQPFTSDSCSSELPASTGYPPYPTTIGNGSQNLLWWTLCRNPVHWQALLVLRAMSTGPCASPRVRSSGRRDPRVPLSVFRSADPSCGFERRERLGHARTYAQHACRLVLNGKSLIPQPRFGEGDTDVPGFRRARRPAELEDTLVPGDQSTVGIAEFSEFEPQWRFRPQTAVAAVGEFADSDA